MHETNIKFNYECGAVSFPRLKHKKTNLYAIKGVMPRATSHPSVFVVPIQKLPEGGTLTKLPQPTPSCIATTPINRAVSGDKGREGDEMWQHGDNGQYMDS